MIRIRVFVMSQLFSVMSVTDATIDILNTLIGTTSICVYRYQRYDWYCLFKPTLRSVFSTGTDVTTGVLELNRRYDWCSQLMSLLPKLRSVLSVRGYFLPFNVDSPFKL